MTAVIVGTPSMGQSVGEKFGINSTLGIAFKTQDYVNTGEDNSGGTPEFLMRRFFAACFLFGVALFPAAFVACQLTSKFSSLIGNCRTRVPVA